MSSPTIELFGQLSTDVHPKTNVWKSFPHSLCIIVFFCCSLMQHFKTNVIALDNERVIVCFVSLSYSYVRIWPPCCVYCSGRICITHLWSNREGVLGRRPQGRSLPGCGKHVYVCGRRFVRSAESQTHSSRGGRRLIEILCWTHTHTHTYIHAQKYMAAKIYSHATPFVKSGIK